MRYLAVVIGLLLLGSCATAKKEEPKQLGTEFPMSFNGKEYVMDCSKWAGGSSKRYHACLGWMKNIT